MNKKDDEVTGQLARVMYAFSNFTVNERIANKLQARKIATTADWGSLIKNYIYAHNLAVEGAFKQ